MCKHCVCSLCINMSQMCSCELWFLVVLVVFVEKMELTNVQEGNIDIDIDIQLNFDKNLDKCRLHKPSSHSHQQNCTSCQINLCQCHTLPVTVSIPYLGVKRRWHVWF